MTRTNRGRGKGPMTYTNAPFIHPTFRMRCPPPPKAGDGHPFKPLTCIRSAENIMGVLLFSTTMILSHAQNFSRKKMDPIGLSVKTHDQIHDCFIFSAADRQKKQLCIWSGVFTEKPIGSIFLREKFAAYPRMSLTRSSASSHTSQAKLTLYNQSERS